MSRLRSIRQSSIQGTRLSGWRIKNQILDGLDRFLCGRLPKPIREARRIGKGVAVNFILENYLREQGCLK